ncbi:hypothetical protein CDA56_23570 [Klebsiella michiganensis]|nr:hypothetical protein [Klebsiella michiganensis]MBX4797277.1 hypothetical protein [Klebsiella michiganensis]POT73531.1 hypothetical protein C3378_21240 [Klebsiella michiganensis]PPA45940.1 hypothetical protein CDA56_23570 [Klebsiella michiganensis]
MDFPTLGRPTSATTGIMLNASYKNRYNARFHGVFKKAKTAPVCQGPFLKNRLPLLLTRNRVQRAVFRLNQ